MESIPERACTFDIVPTEVKRIVFIFLNPSDLLRCLLVCKEWNKVVNDDLLWMHHCKSLLHSLNEEEDTLWNKIICKFLKSYLLTKGTTDLSFYDCFWSLQLIRRKILPPVWQDCGDWYWLNRLEERGCLPQSLSCYNGSVNRIVSHLFRICSIPWCQVLTTHYQHRKCLCGITSERDIFAWTIALAMKLGQCIFLKKVQEVLDIPSLKWMLSARQRKGNTTWLMGNIQRIVDAAGQDGIPVSHRAAIVKQHKDAEADSACSSKQASVFVPTIVIPIQERCLKVLTSFIRATSPEDLHTQAIGGRALIEVINNTLNTTSWFVAVQAVEDVKAQLTMAAAKRICNLTYSLPTTEEFEPSLCNIKLDPKTTASEIKARSLEMMVFFNGLQVASYLSEESSMAALHPITRALQTYSQALTTPITSFCYGNNENSDKVSILEHAIDICFHLHKMKDFLSLKYLLSAIRASISQGHSTHVSWKNISDKGCKRFKKFEDIMTAQKGYDKYLHTVQGLREQYIPFLPAHQLQVQRGGVHSSKTTTKDWIQMHISTRSDTDKLLATRCVDFLCTDIGTQLRAGQETWNVLSGHD